MLKNIDVTKNPTSAQIEMLAKASRIHISANAEYPEFSKTELSQFTKIRIK